MKDDLISRAAAIDLIRSMESDATSHGISPRLTPSHVINGIESLPSAERPAGEWIKDEFGITVCSECKRPRRDSRVDHINFCNSCGARMINTK